MWLLDKMLSKAITVGELVVTNYDGKIHRYGTPTPGMKRVAVRLTDKGAAFHIAKDPRVGAGEVYMDERLIVEEGDIRDLILLVQKNASGSLSLGFRHWYPPFWLTTIERPAIQSRRSVLVNRGFGSPTPGAPS